MPVVCFLKPIKFEEDSILSLIANIEMCTNYKMKLTLLGVVESCGANGETINPWFSSQFTAGTEGAVFILFEITEKTSKS